MAIKIITDSASDISINNDEVIIVIPLTIEFADKEYKDGINISHDMFYTKLAYEGIFPKTSQVTPYEFEQEYKKIKQNGDRAIVITVSKKLSGTYSSAVTAAKQYEDCISVVDSTNASVGQQILVKYTHQLLSQGLKYENIINKLENIKHNIVVLALLDTLEYLRKGGRIPAALAIIANMISIKPVLSIQNGKIEMLGKARGLKKGRTLLNETIEKTGIDFSKPLLVGYTGLDDSHLIEYIEGNRNLWENSIDNLPMTSIGATVGAHTGPNAIGVAYFKKNL